MEILDDVKEHIQLTLFDFVKNDFIKSPLNYIGGKFKILNQIVPLFPKNINSFIDLFAGGFNVGINIKANKFYANDNIKYLIDMFKEFQIRDVKYTMGYIEKRIKKFNLSLTNEDGYKKLRKTYNKEKNALDLFVLVAYSFNHQIRFNSSHEFNNPFGKKRSHFNNTMKNNLYRFILKLKQQNVIFSSKCFQDFDFDFLEKNDFVYCDPPYLITTGTYNDGNRGFEGWNEKEEKELLKILDNLNGKKIKFALSNVLEHKGKKNKLLEHWINNNPNYNVHNINFDYSNSNYQTKIKDKNSSKEILITNY